MSILEDLKMEYRTGGVVQRLIFWNIGLFVIPMITFSILRLFGIELPLLNWSVSLGGDLFSLSSDPADLLWKPWSLITYAFLHADVGHIFFNMLWLYFSGRVFLTFFNQKQFFGLYILSAAFAGMVFLFSYNLIPAFTPGFTVGMVGASAAIMSVIVGAAVFSPFYNIRLMLIGNVKLWHIAAFFIVVDLIMVSVANKGGHISHLSGSLFGYIYIKLLQNGTDLSKGVSAILDFFANLFKPKKSVPFKKVHRNTTTQAAAPKAAKPAKDITQKKIDDILDKISKSGYDSLTKEEKDFLFRINNNS